MLFRLYLDRPMRRWREATEGGYVWPMGGVGERFHVSNVTDEGCSEADWLRLNLTLWRLTGQTRFLDMAERLLWNHYAMNRTANGGYGHHNFVCDADGPLLMQPKFTEAVWCCTFHGILGLETLKRCLVEGSNRGVFVNFPADVVATVATNRGRWKATVVREDRPGAVTCAVRLDPAEDAAAIPELYLRRPDWADQVQATDRAGRSCPTASEHGYLRLPVRPGAEGEVRVIFSFKPRIEDLRLHTLSIGGSAVGRHRGVTLFDGPRLLLANTQQQRPTIVVPVDVGRPVLSSGKEGCYSVALIDRFEAGEKAIAESLPGGPRMSLTPWDRTARGTPAAFVFDVITVPAPSEIVRPAAK